MDIEEQNKKMKLKNVVKVMKKRRTRKKILKRMKKLILKYL
jgi:hypothetical protein